MTSKPQFTPTLKSELSLTSESPSKSTSTNTHPKTTSSVVDSNSRKNHALEAIKKVHQYYCLIIFFSEAYQANSLTLLFTHSLTDCLCQSCFLKQTVSNHELICLPYKHLTSNKKKTHWHSFTALNRESEKSAADWLSQTHMKRYRNFYYNKKMYHLSHNKIEKDQI